MDFKEQSCKYTNCDVADRSWPINELNVSGVHEFNQLCNGLNRFNEDISGWDASNMQAMVQTFQYAQQFNQVMYIHIRIMFLIWVLVLITHHHFSHLTMQDINAWDMSCVFVMVLTFINALSFDQGRIPAYQCLSSSWTHLSQIFISSTWYLYRSDSRNTSSVSGGDGFLGMFHSALVFNGDISG